MPERQKTSRALTHHTAKHPLWSDRSYVAFEHNVIRSDLATALQGISTLIPPGEIQDLCRQTKAVLEAEVYDDKKLSELLDKARALAWQYNDFNNWASVLMMFLSFASYGNPINPKTPSTT